MEEKKEKQIVNSQAEGTAPEGTPKAAAPEGTPKAAAPEDPAKEATPEESLKAALAKQAIEEEASGSASFTLRKILGGDILTAQIIRKQIWLFVLIVFFVIIYISNRYSIQKDLIELDQLQKELQDTKYKALSTSSQITEKSRESNVLDVLKHSKDSILHIATQPPYIINVPEE
ncbi:MAG: FtsL-like putative cell division protein [Prevotella sp.]